MPNRFRARPQQHAGQRYCVMIVDLGTPDMFN
jgi:hypothetical protein